MTEYFLARGPAAFIQNLVIPLLQEIGRRWSENRLSISSEHMFTASVRNLLGLAWNQGPAQPSRMVAVFTTPQGELHELAVLAAAVSAKSHGVRAVYLGPQLPPEEVIGAAEKLDADLVCLGSLTLDPSDLGRQLQMIVSRLPDRTRLWLGVGDGQRVAFPAHPKVRIFTNLFDFESAVRIESALAVR